MESLKAELPGKASRSPSKENVNHTPRPPENKATQKEPKGAKRAQPKDSPGPAKPGDSAEHHLKQLQAHKARFFLTGDKPATIRNVAA